MPQPQNVFASRRPQSLHFFAEGLQSEDPLSPLSTNQVPPKDIQITTNQQTPSTLSTTKANQTEKRTKETNSTSGKSKYKQFKKPKHWGSNCSYTMW